MESSPHAIDPLTLAHARWAAYDMSSTELSDVATELIQSGYDCPALWELVCTDEWDLVAEGPPLFDRAMQELGQEPLCADDATLVVARGAAAECLAGQITPREFAVQIFRLACVNHYPDHLTELVELNDAYGDVWGSGRADLDSATLDAARTLLQPN